MNDPDQIAWDAALDGNLGERLAAYEDPADLDDRAAGPATGLVSLGFLWAALGRTVRLWCTLAVLGLIIGAGYYVARPPAYKATTSLLLADNSSQNSVNEAQTDLALAQSLPVATAVVRQLGLPQTPESFLGSYTVASRRARRSLRSLRAERRAARRSRSRRRSPSSSSPSAPPTSRPSTTC